MVKIDDAYPWPENGILALASCNRCYDLRQDLIKATDNIRNACIWLTQHPDMPAEKREYAAKRLEKWTRDYAETIAAQNNASTVVWSEEMAELLMQKPDKWYECLRIYRRSVREQVQSTL